MCGGVFLSVFLHVILRERACGSVGAYVVVCLHGGSSRVGWADGCAEASRADAAAEHTAALTPRRFRSPSPPAQPRATAVV